MNNYIKKILWSVACLLLWAFSLNAQVSGTVKDGYGHVLQGVLIISENEKNITITDQNGDYELIVNDESEYLTFSLQGYISHRLDIDEKAYGEKTNVSALSRETFVFSP